MSPSVIDWFRINVDLACLPELDDFRTIGIQRVNVQHDILSLAIRNELRVHAQIRSRQSVQEFTVGRSNFKGVASVCEPLRRVRATIVVRIEKDVSTCNDQIGSDSRIDSGLFNRCWSVRVEGDR